MPKGIALKTHQVEQGTLDWLKLHIGRPTASEFGQLMTPEFKRRTGEMPHTYLCKKVAEAFRGQPLPAFGSWQTDQGLIREEEAIPWYELEYDTKIQQVGFVTSDDERCGCSPDGLISGGGIEIKCPEAHTHVKYLLNCVLPPEYVTQVYGSMYVTGCKMWRFMSYRRKFPALVLTIERDEEIMSKIRTALDQFYVAFDFSMERIKEISTGGVASAALVA